MLKQGGGSILNVSTVARMKAIPFFQAHAYQAAKAGVDDADQISSGRVCKAGHPLQLHLSRGRTDPAGLRRC